MRTAAFRDSRRSVYLSPGTVNINVYEAQMFASRCEARPSDERCKQPLRLTITAPADLLLPCRLPPALERQETNSSSRAQPSVPPLQLACDCDEVSVCGWHRDCRQTTRVCQIKKMYFIRRLRDRFELVGLRKLRFKARPSDLIAPMQ